MSNKTRWEMFKIDFRERFLNFETAKGVYLVPAGLIIIYVTIFYIQFIIQAAGVVLGWYIVSEGLRKIFVNRIKQAVVVERLKQWRREIDNLFS